MTYGMHRSRIREENTISGGEWPFSPCGRRVGMRGAAGQRPGRFGLPPSPQPLSREGRGALFSARQHALLQARDLCTLWHRGVTCCSERQPWA
ncbi:protein of unknown function (plasmid) [Azospirillum lipoferum 4B]|uniref:Uncharacterized protein n=1 Tax=Azospirillum lipoferum (strain 4B) TaxID=862719 RepID=G7ZEM9_AZOL4|nr:protein of unknown function [Azospirillum lipoferum 4B]